MEPFKSIDEFLIKLSKCPCCHSLFSYTMADELSGKSTWNANIKCKCYHNSYNITGKLLENKQFDLYNFWANKYFVNKDPVATVRFFIEYTYYDEVLLLCLDDKNNLIKRIENPSQEDLLSAFDEFKKHYKAFSLLG